MRSAKTAPVSAPSIQRWCMSPNSSDDRMNASHENWEKLTVSKRREINQR